MGNILASVVSYNQTDVYIFKDTNSIISTICRIKFMAVDNVPTTSAKHWTISSNVNALDYRKYDVTLEYHLFEGPLSDYELLPYTSNITRNLLLTSFEPFIFLLNSNTIIITPTAEDPSFTVTIVNTLSIIEITEDFKNAIFRIVDSETEIFGYLRDNTGNDIAITDEESVLATSKNFNNKNRLEISSLILPKGKWLVTATGSFNCSAASKVYFWFDVGGLLDEIINVPQFKNSLRAFNSQSNSNMALTMHATLTFEEPTIVYWCTTPEIDLNSSILDTNIPPPSTANPFIAHAISNGCNNNAKITAVTISSN